MKKAVVLIAVLLVSTIGFTACSVPNIGEMEVVNATESAQPEKNDLPTNETATENADEQVAEGAHPSNDDVINDPAEEEILSEGSQKEETSNSSKAVQASSEALQPYIDRINCKTTVISNNNMIVQVQNNNTVTIPTLTVNVNYPNETKTYDFRQIPVSGKIIIPVEKESGDLPPAVSADVTISMKDNQYTDVSSLLEISTNPVDNTSYTMTIVNLSDRACQKLSITALFSNESGIFCAQKQNASETILSGGTSTITFTLPQKLIDEGVTFTDVSYVINEAVG